MRRVVTNVRQNSLAAGAGVVKMHKLDKSSRLFCTGL